MLNNENKRVGYTEVYYNYNANKFFTEDFGNQFKELSITFSGGGSENAIESGDNISLLSNDAGYLASGANITSLVNNAGYLTSVSLPTFASLPTTGLSVGNVCALTSDNRPYFYDGTNWRRIFLADAPPASGDPDTDWDKVILRLPFNTNVNDVKSSIGGSLNGSNAVIVGSPRKFGAGALKVQSSSNVEYNGVSVGTFLDNDFTIEFWLYIDSFNAQSQDTGILRKGSTYFYFDYGGFDQMIFRIKLTNTAPESNLSFNTVGNMPAQTWMHVAFCRNATSGACQLFINGTTRGTVSLNDMVDGTQPLMIGDMINGSADMFVDDLRISNFERYTSNFTAPTAELPTSGT